MANNIWEQIEENISERKNIALGCNPIFAESHGEILELIDLYWVDKFRDNARDSLGFLRPFYNVVENPSLVSSKMIDIDTKDVRIIAEEGQSYYPAWLFGKDLRLWMKVKKFGQLLNEIIYDWPKYGSIVLKKAGDEVSLVPIGNLYMEPGAETLINSAYVIEKHDYSPAELRKKDWDNIEEAIEKFGEDGHIFVYEAYGEVDSRDNYFIVASNEDLKEGVVLYHTKLDEMPYRELNWDKIPGRWLGRGQVERLFHSQIYINTLANYKAHGAHWTSKHLYQTRDEGVTRNLLTETDDGEVLIVNSELTPVAVEERNLPFYASEEARWDRLVDKRTFSYDVVRGEKPRALTLGQSVLQTRMAGGFFDLKKEDLGMFLKEVLFDWVIPEFSKQKNKAHKLMLGEFNEGELDKLRGLLLTNRTNKSVLDWVRRNGRIPTSPEYNIQRMIVGERLKTQKDMEIPANYYKNLKYKIDIVITSEQIDMAAKLSAYQYFAGLVFQNPEVLRDKTARKFLLPMMELAGISPVEFEKEELGLGEVVQEQAAQRGGSIARTPTPTTTPTAVSVPTRM